MASDTLSPPITHPMIPDLLRLRAARHPDRTPINVDSTAAITYAEWERRSNAVAHELVGRGVGRGDRVALFFGGMDWIDYAVAYFGVLKTGATATHLNDQLDAAELRRRLAHAAPAGLIHGVALHPPAGFPGWTATAGALDGGCDTPLEITLGPDDISDIFYTSGTTGPAKPFTNPHGTLVFGQGLASAANFDASAPLLAPMPLGTASSAGTVGLFAMTTTATIIVCPVDDVERMAALIDLHAVGSVMSTPMDAMRMVQARVHERHDLRSVTTIGIASAPLPAPYARALLAMMPNATIRTAYGGGSEAVPASIVNVYDPDRPTCAGRPRPGTDLRVLDEDGTQVPAGEVGEVWLRTGAPKRRYLDEGSYEQVHVGGWTRTRDLGYLGRDGDLYFFDRGTDAIRTRGALVSSIEVEGALYEHPAVREAAVIGVPDAEGGQAVVAVVVLSASDTPCEPPDLRAFVAARLAPHQVPSAVHVVASLPRGSTGKVLKYRLRERYAPAAGRAPGRSQA